MVFFKWYGVNVDTFVDIPAFHQKWKHVRTIGVSIFRRKVSTAKHFGYLRATFRVLALQPQRHGRLPKRTPAVLSPMDGARTVATSRSLRLKQRQA
jgi:hypothetical protein